MDSNFQEEFSFFQLQGAAFLVRRRGSLVKQAAGEDVGRGREGGNEEVQ